LDYPSEGIWSAFGAFALVEFFVRCCALFLIVRRPALQSKYPAKTQSIRNLLLALLVTSVLLGTIVVTIGAASVSILRLHTRRMNAVSTTFGI
jgi:hypothetical protein